MEKQVSVKRYNSIDLVKFLMAFAVVAIHTNPMVNCSNESLVEVYDIVVNLAVPFFFLASGYLLSSKMCYPFNDDRSVKRVRNSAKRIAKMYLCWMLVYTPLAIYHFIDEGTPLVLCVFEYVKGFVFLGEQYNSWPLWYLLSMCYALLAIGFLLSKKVGAERLLLVAMIASVVCVSFDYLSSSEDVMSVPLKAMKKVIGISIGSGRIFKGLVFIPIGMFLFHKRIPMKANWVMLLLGASLDFFVSNQCAEFYLNIMTAVGIFGVVESIDLEDSNIYGYLRKSSMHIYLLHMYVWTFYYFVVYGEKTEGVDSFVITSLGSLLLSVAYISVSKKISDRKSN